MNATNEPLVPLEPHYSDRALSGLDVASAWVLVIVAVIALAPYWSL